MARTERWATDLIATLAASQDRRLAKAYATWRVLRRLRRDAVQRPRPRTNTAVAHTRLRAAVDFLTWLASQNLTLTDCKQSDVDRWLETRPSAGSVRDFLLWAAEHHHCPALHVAPPPRNNGTASDPEQRWEQITRLLHDEYIDLTDRVAGCLSWSTTTVTTATSRSCASPGLSTLWLVERVGPGQGRAVPGVLITVWLRKSLF